MPAAATYAAIRFGTGLSGRHPPPAGGDALLAELDGPDRAAERFPVAGFEARRPVSAEFLLLRRAMKSGEALDRERLRSLTRQMRETARRDALSYLARGVFAADTFRERLTYFWADHFTVRARARSLRGTVTNYIEDAIRPHLAGSFGQMLTAVITHPLMIIYLDQQNSIGPGSKVGRTKGKGPNENLARELLELHSLGADGPYTQADVQQLALLLTGLTARLQSGTVFMRTRAEPGAETVLGRDYGGGRAELADIETFLADLAVHPATARNLARKLAVHFVSDTPDPSLVEHVAAAYSEGGGDLRSAYAALLEHPAAWRDFGQKAKRPQEFIVSGLRALDPPAQGFTEQKRKDAERAVFGPMARMGQKFQQPGGPDGWPEEPQAWITPQGLAARIDWAMSMPRTLLSDLPDPRGFVDRALGDAASPRLRWAAAAAQNRWEGLGVILASPDFNRR